VANERCRNFAGRVADVLEAGAGACARGGGQKDERVRPSASTTRRMAAGAVIAVGAAGMMVVAVLANLEPPG
jgi:hypothetical protein